MRPVRRAGWVCRVQLVEHHCVCLCVYCAFMCSALFLKSAERVAFCQFVNRDRSERQTCRVLADVP